jgi:predicted patatin/cPLA2 family phospholipase
MPIIEDLAFLLPGGTYKVLVQIPSLIFCELLGIYPKKIWTISGGGPNAVGFLLKKAKRLPAIWNRIEPRKLFDVDWREILLKRRPLFDAEALFSSYFVDDVLREEIDCEVLRDSETELFLGVVDLAAGYPDQIRFVSMKDLNLNVNQLLEAFIGMVRIPVFFRPLEGGNFQFVDLGLVNNFPVGEAVQDGFSKIVTLSALPVSLSPIEKIHTWPEINARHDDIEHVHEINRHLAFVSRLNESVEALSYIKDNSKVQEVCLTSEELKGNFERLYSAHKRKIDVCVVAPPSSLRIFRKTEKYPYGYPSLEARYELLGAGYEAVRLTLIPFFLKYDIVTEETANRAWREIPEYIFG